MSWSRSKLEILREEARSGLCGETVPVHTKIYYRALARALEMPMDTLCEAR